MGHFRCGVEMVKHFVNFDLYFIVSNLKRISKMLIAPPEKIIRTPMHSPDILRVTLLPLIAEK